MLGYILFGLVCIAAAVGLVGMSKTAPENMGWYIPYALVLVTLGYFMYLY